MAVTKQTARSHPKTVAMAKATQPTLPSRVPSKKSTTKSSSSAAATTSAATTANEKISVSSVPGPALKRSKTQKTAVIINNMKSSPLPTTPSKLGHGINANDYPNTPTDKWNTPTTSNALFPQGEVDSCIRLTNVEGVEDISIENFLALQHIVNHLTAGKGVTANRLPDGLLKENIKSVFSELGGDIYDYHGADVSGFQSRSRQRYLQGTFQSSILQLNYIHETDPMPKPTVHLASS
eukprot:scaffold11636_cov62-Cyclotella_meneghiniana.AAC.10